MSLKEFFEENKKIALAFSGGCDSAYLLYEVVRNNADVTAYFVKTQFQPDFELNDAVLLAKQLGAKLKIINLDILANSEIAKNPCNRCYLCKSLILSEIIKAAKKDGYNIIIDGTNADDNPAERPGMSALAELKIKSPLRDNNISKREIREKSKNAGLFTWDKPAYACLATRIRSGKEILASDLVKIEQGEEMIKNLGFKDIRIRLSEDNALLQFKKEDNKRALSMEKIISKELKDLFPKFTIDTKGR